MLEITKDNIDPALANLFEFQLSKGDLKKSEIIVATIDCLADLGLEKTSFAAIAGKMGTQKSHVNYYFKNKDDIFIEIYRYIAGTYQNYTMQAFDKARSKKSLNNFLSAYFLWCEENQKQLSAMFLLYYFCQHKPHFREINQKIREGGVERISYLLKEEFGMSARKARTIAKGVQAIMSHTAVDIYTFKKEDKNREIKIKEARKLIRILVKQA